MNIWSVFFILLVIFFYKSNF